MIAYWDGYHDFGKLADREARRTQPARIGPRRDELGTFATLISRFVRLPPACEQALRAPGDGPAVDLVHELEGSGEVERLAAMDVAQGLGYLWPRLRELADGPARLRTGRDTAASPAVPRSQSATGCSARIFIHRGHARNYALIAAMK